MTTKDTEVQKWEHKLVSFRRYHNYVQEMNDLGSEGWEAAGLHIDDLSITVLFKRRVP